MMRIPANDPAVSGQDLLRFCDLLYEHSGMQFGESKRYYIERRLLARVRDSGASSLANYLHMLLVSPDEMQRAINSMAVSETYFYREEHQLTCLTGALLPEIVRGKGPGDRIRIWSASCATGEEAYSIALWLLENWPLVDAYNVEIVGSDINTDSLATARAGRYGARSIGRLPDAVLKTYFRSDTGEGWEIIRDLKESVDFTPANLINRASMTRQGTFDVIFCRNTMMYFDERARSVAADALFAGMMPGGFLCLGHSETMTRVSDRFDIRRFGNAIVYQRPAT